MMLFMDAIELCIRIPHYQLKKKKKKERKKERRKKNPLLRRAGS